MTEEDNRTNTGSFESRLRTKHRNTRSRHFHNRSQKPRKTSKKRDTLPHLHELSQDLPGVVHGGSTTVRASVTLEDMWYNRRLQPGEPIKLKVVSHVVGAVVKRPVTDGSKKEFTSQPTEHKTIPSIPRMEKTRNLSGLGLPSIRQSTIDLPLLGR